MPAQYICGSKDGAILCNKPFAMETEKYCKGGYRYVEVDGGHDPMTENNQATLDTVDAIVWRVKTADGESHPTPEPSTSQPPAWAVAGDGPALGLKTPHSVGPILGHDGHGVF